MGGVSALVLLPGEGAAVHARTLCAAVRAALRASHTGTLHAVFPTPALTSMPAHVAGALLEQLQSAPRAALALALAGNGVVVDLVLEATDAAAGAYVLRFGERVAQYVPADAPAPARKRARLDSQREAEALPARKVR